MTAAARPISRHRAFDSRPVGTETQLDTQSDEERTQFADFTSVWPAGETRRTCRGFTEVREVPVATEIVVSRVRVGVSPWLVTAAFGLVASVSQLER